MKTIAVILAAGSGRRLGGEVPKQFLSVAGRSILEMTIDVFEASPLISEICVVANPDHIADVERIATRNSFSKLRRIVPGGSQRSDSSVNAIRAYAQDDPDAILMFHDSVRPLVSADDIAHCVAAMQSHRAVALGRPSTDTIWVIDNDRDISRIPPRDSLFNAQTPQCFRLADIRLAYETARKDPAFTASDDCGVILRYLPDCRIHVIEASGPNIKITFPEDLLLLERIVASAKPVTGDFLL